MKNLLRGGVAVAAVVVLTACGLGTKPAAERAQQLVTDLSIQQVGWISLRGEQVSARYVKDGAWQTASNFKGESEVHGGDSTDYGWKPVPLADLKVAELDAQVAAQGEKCSGEVGMTTAGARLSLITCSGTVVSTALDGKELPEIKQWDAASIDLVLAELKSTQGEQSQHLRFLTPKSGSLGASVSVSSVGPKVKGVGGEECMITVGRAGVPTGNLGLLNWGTCTSAEAFGTGPFPLAGVTGAKVEAALVKASALMEMSPADVGYFDVFLDGDKMIVQVTAGSGVETKDGFPQQVPLG